MTVTSTIFAFGMMPFLMWFYNKALGGSEDAESFNLVELVRGLVLVLIPVGGGILLRTYGNPALADRMVSVGSALGFAFIFIIMIYYLADYDNRQILVETEGNVYIGTIALGVVGATLGYCTARFVAKEQPRQCRTIAFETGIQNGPLSIGIANAAFLFSRNYEYVFDECVQLCRTGVKYGCGGSETENTYGYSSCADETSGFLQNFFNVTEELSGRPYFSDPDLMDQYQFSDDDRCGDIKLVSELDSKLAGDMCARLYCTDGYRADALDYNPKGLDSAAYEEKYGENLVPCSFFSKLLGSCEEGPLDTELPTGEIGTSSFKPGFESVRIPHNLEDFLCPDYRATVVPLMYSFWICFTSPLMMLFFLFVLGARHEDSLWAEVPEHKWLWTLSFEKCIDLTVIDRVDMLMERYSHHRAVACKLSGTTKGPWTYWSFGDYHRHANAVTRFLIDMGLENSKPTAILSFNRREWFVADLGTIYAGGVPAGIYPTDTPKQVEYILNHSESQFVFVENEKQLEKVRSIRNKLLHVKEIVVFDRKGDSLQEKGTVTKNAAELAKEKEAEDEEADGGDDSMVIEEESEWAMEFEKHVHYFEDIMAKYYTDTVQTMNLSRKLKGKKFVINCTEQMDQESLDALDLVSAKRRAELRPEDVLCMIYTSGTTGPPKAVMITHRNVGWCIFSIGDIMKCSPEDTVLSYLPLCHIAEKTVSLYGPLIFGMNVYFCAPDALRGTLVKTMRQVGPTVFFGVPRIWEKIQEKMIASSGKQPVYFLFCIPTGSFGKRKWRQLVLWAKDLGLKGSYMRQQNLKMPKNWWYANEIVFQNVKVALGLQRCRICISAAAPLSIETAEFFMGLNIIIYECFGMSETAGPVSFNQPYKDGWRTNSCGKPIMGVELKIADDGELLVRGACTCRGYYKNPEETANLIDEEKWIHTGDIGTVDADGFLYITDRKKHLIITAGGENIAPAPIEGSLGAMPGIGHAVLIGDMQKFLVCLLTIDSAGATYFAHKNYGYDGPKEDFRKATAYLRDEKKCKYKDDLWAKIEEINKHLPRVSTVKKFYILEKDFSDQGNMCELTPTLKVKHRVVKQKYYKVIKKIYGKDFKETQAKAQGSAQMVSNLKINTGMWPGNRTIVALLFATKDGKICIDDGKGCLPSVVLPDQGILGVSSSETIKFVWCQQFCKNLARPPQFNADRTFEDMNVYGMMVTNAMISLKSIVDDSDIGTLYPKLLSDYYKQDLKSAVLGCVRVVDDEKSVKIKGGSYTWVDAKKKPEYMSLLKLANISKTNNTVLTPGKYVAYLSTASTRSGLSILTEQTTFSNIPCVKYDDEFDEAVDLELLRLIRPTIKKGGKIKDVDHPQTEKFIEGLEKLMAKLSIEEDETSLEKFVAHMYDFDFVTLDRGHSVKFCIIMAETTMSNLNLPPHLKKKHHLVPMAVYEPNHFYMWHSDVYGEMQDSVLARNREASEMNYRVQHGQGVKGERQRHKDEKEAIRKDARRWDCMKWHMKLIHWQSVEKSACYTDILNDEAQERMTPAEQIKEVKENWVDEYGDWEREAILICSEADGWNHLQIEMEKNKFTAKFRQKAGTAAASSMRSGTMNFKSAGASTAWGNSRVGDSSMMSTSSSNFRSSVTSSVDSGKSVVSGASSVDSDEEEVKAAKVAAQKSGLSLRQQAKELERSNRERRVSRLAAATSNLKADDATAALTQTDAKQTYVYVDKEE